MKCVPIFMLLWIPVLGILGQERGSGDLPEVLQEYREKIDRSKMEFDHIVVPSLRAELAALRAANEELWEENYIENEVVRSGMNTEDQQKVLVLLREIRNSILRIEALANREIPQFFESKNTEYQQFYTEWQEHNSLSSSVKKANKEFLRDVKKVKKDIRRHLGNIIRHLTIYTRDQGDSESGFSIVPELITRYIRYSNRFAEGGQEKDLQSY